MKMLIQHAAGEVLPVLAVVEAWNGGCAAKHGWQYTAERSDPLEARATPQGRAWRSSQFSFQRFYFLLQALKNPLCEVAVIIDCDSLIVNQAIPLDADFPRGDVGLVEWGGRDFHSAVIMVRNTPGGRCFVRYCYERRLLNAGDSNDAVNACTPEHGVEIARLPKAWDHFIYPGYAGVPAGVNIVSPHVMSIPEKIKYLTAAVRHLQRQ
ncbi:MAG TPA: hypothetical protein VGP72_14765 [Planctomycetota bacterium]|jgi:hypothetical protein